MASVPGSFPGPGPSAPAAGAVSSLCFHDPHAYFNDMLTRGLSHLVPTHLETAFGAYCHRFNAKSSVASSVLSDPGQLRHPSSPSDLSDLATLPSDHCRINLILVERKANQLAVQYRAYQEQQRREQRRRDEAQAALPGSHHVHSDHHLTADDDRARCVSVPAERARDEERREIQAQYAAELSGYEQQLDRYKSLSQEAVSCKDAMEAARLRLLRQLTRVDALDVESGDDDHGEEHRHDDDKGGAPREKWQPRNTTDCASHVAVPQPRPRPQTPQTRADCAEEWRFDRLASARRPRRRGQEGKNGREGKAGAPGGA